MSDVYVLGVDMIKFGRFPERTVPDLGAEAALLALDDAGLNIGNMEAFYCGNLGQANAMVGQRILQEIGQTGIPVVNCSNACATGATAFREAWTSIKAGLYDVVLAVGVEQMGTGLLGGAGGGALDGCGAQEAGRGARGQPERRQEEAHGAAAARQGDDAGGQADGNIVREEKNLQRCRPGQIAEGAHRRGHGHPPGDRGAIPGGAHEGISARPAGGCMQGYEQRS